MKTMNGLFLFMLASLGGGNTLAFADTLSEKTSAKSQKEEPPSTVTPLATSQHKGHLKLGLTPALMVLPYGRLGSGLSLGDAARTGFGFATDIAFGVGHSVEMGLYGDWSKLGQPSDCKECELTSLTFGVFAKAYLVQGLKVAPWLSYGAGTRLYSVKGLSGNEENEGTYASFEWLHLSLGMDWFASRYLGAGTFLSLSAAQVVKRPSSYLPSEDDTRKNGAEGRFLAGFRLFLDAPGRP